MSYTCPRHNKPMKSWPGGKWSCPTKVGDGWCDYGKSEEFKALLAKPAVANAAPAPVGTTESGSGSPRLQAAGMALQAAAVAYAGQAPEQIMAGASLFYHRFLKRAFHGEIPTEKESDFGPGPDDDIPF